MNPDGYSWRMDRAFPRSVAVLFAAVAVVAILAMLRSLTRDPERGQRPAMVVVVDAGHGGDDGGTVVFGLKEKDLALDLARRLARALEVRGLKAVLTRSDDSSVPLDQRVSVAREHPGAVFVSLHLNRFGSHSVQGLETYVCSPPDPVEIRLEPGDAPRSYRDHRSHLLAERIAEAAAEASGLQARGVREAGFKVLKDVPAPAVLVECGYLSNPEDARLLAKSEVRAKLAEAIAGQIDRFLLERRENRLLGFSAWAGDPPPKPAPESTATPDAPEGEPSAEP